MRATVDIVVACIRVRMQLVIIASYHYMKFSGWSSGSQLHASSKLLVCWIMASAVHERVIKLSWIIQ